MFDDFKPGLQSYIPLILPNTKQFFSSTLQFSNPDLKPYTRICIESCLHLGHVKNMMVSRNIQIRPFEVQFAESYSPSPVADYLVIVNNQTQYDEMMAWRALIRRLGGLYLFLPFLSSFILFLSSFPLFLFLFLSFILSSLLVFFFLFFDESSVCVWNLHLYGDLTLSHVRNDMSTLLKDFRCKNIILLNNLSLRDEKLQLRPVEFARKRELFLAARGINNT